MGPGIPQMREVGHRVGGRGCAAGFRTTQPIRSLGDLTRYRKAQIRERVARRNGWTRAV